MKTITLEEFNDIKPEEMTVVDIRKPEDFGRGSVKGAVNIPITEIKERWSELNREKPVYLMCYTGGRLSDAAGLLEKEGYTVCVIEGGYANYLKKSLEDAVADEENMKLSTKEIERSIIKKYRKSLWRPFTKGIKEYQLVQEGDKIAVCISGGKDSMLLAKMMQELQRHGEVPFELVFLMMDPGYRKDNRRITENNAKLLGIPLTIFESDIFEAVTEVDRNACYLCARMRRGHLYANAKALGCNKIALGHHFDDVIETILMGMLYGGKIETMMPKLHSINFAGMELIRPLYLVKEEAIRAWRDSNGLGFLQCACRFTENCVSVEDEHRSKRDEMTELIAEFRKRSEFIESNIFRSVHNINLRTVIGYHKDGMSYNFLDDYENYELKEEG